MVMPKIPTLSLRTRMLRDGTPVEDHTAEWGLYVKREDLACRPPGPPFSKTRGVFAWCSSRPEPLIGVLDTRHSQGGHAVAFACRLLGKRCVVFYPEFKHEPGPRPPQLAAAALGAELVGLPAGRSAILYHAARRETEASGGAIIPNALKLTESVLETAAECGRTPLSAGVGTVLIPASSGTIAAGVILGYGRGPRYIVHLGYSRSHDEVRRYLTDKSGVSLVDDDLILVDEGYAYKDGAGPGPTPPWPCNDHYDLKAVRWWYREGRHRHGRALLWNIG